MKTRTKRVRAKMNNNEDIRDPQDPSMTALKAVLIFGHSSPVRECSGSRLVRKIIRWRPFSKPHPVEAETHQEIHTDEQLNLDKKKKSSSKQRTQESAIMVIIVVVVAAAAEAVDNSTRESKSSQKILKQLYYHQMNGHRHGKGLLNLSVGAIC